MPTTKRFLSILAVAFLAGCGAAVDEGESGTNVIEPLVIGGADAADEGCNVILREAHRPAGQTGGYEVATVDALGWYVWQGTIDISEAAAAEAANVGVLFTAGGPWLESLATQIDGAPAGFVRYQFRLTENTVRDGMSLTSLMRTRLEIAPFVRSTAGGRLFDHNRNPDPLANYVLNSDNGWTVGEAPEVCAAKRETRSVVQFLNGWQTVQHGALVAGGKLIVEYDLPRLPDCRNTHNGYPAWDTLAYVRFAPGGELFEQSVRAFETNQGQPTNNAYSVPFELTIPEGATSAELWFKNFSGAGSSCVTWDSNLGQNYRFEVQATAPAAVVWAGNWGNGFNRACEHVDGIGEPTSIDSYALQRACMFFDAEVYVPGLTDAGERPELLAAQVEYSVDGGAMEYAWLEYVGRVGNNYRYRWSLPRQELTNEPWQTYGFAFRFSTDGTGWFRIGQDAGPEGGAARTIVRGF